MGAGNATPASKLCFCFLVLTAARSAEARGARWNEIDLREREWIVPGERMKRGQEHHQPLSAPALSVLRQAKALDDGSGLVFPSPMRPGGVLDRGTLMDALRGVGIAERTTVHGLRSSFRGWAAERAVTDKDSDAAERCLAHAVRGSNRGSYDRAELLDAKCDLLQEWGGYVCPDSDTTLGVTRRTDRRRRKPQVATGGTEAGGRLHLDTSRTRTLEINREGRDFVVGDVHGCFAALERGLGTLGFDQGRDRLFGVGDLVDRGPDSAAAIDWLEDRFEAVALGNHDRAALEWFDKRRRGLRKDADEKWLTEIDPHDYEHWYQALRCMPLALTIETPCGPVGVIHADPPHPAWARAMTLLERGKSRDIDTALLGYEGPAEETAQRRGQSVEGLYALVSGHRVVDAVQRLGNRWNIDTGAGCGGQLSLLQVDGGRFRTFTFDLAEC